MAVGFSQGGEVRRFGPGDADSRAGSTARRLDAFLQPRAWCFFRPWAILKWFLGECPLPRGEQSCPPR